MWFILGFVLGGSITIVLYACILVAKESDVRCE
jgi:hypothetical protein